MLGHLKTMPFAVITPQHHPLLTRPHHIRQVNHHPGPIRLHLIFQPLVGIEHGFDRAIEVAVVVLAEGVEHVAASGSAGRRLAIGQAQWLELGADTTQGVELFEAAFEAGVDRAFEGDSFAAHADGLLVWSAGKWRLCSRLKLGVGCRKSARINSIGRLRWWSWLPCFFDSTRTLWSNVKNRDKRLVMPHTVAKSVIEKQRGQHKL